MAPFLDTHSGFPFTAIDDGWLTAGMANGFRLPWTAALDLSGTWIVGLPRHLPQARVGIKLYNLISTHTERDVQRDIDRPDFGTCATTRCPATSRSSSSFSGAGATRRSGVPTPPVSIEAGSPDDNRLDRIFAEVRELHLQVAGVGRVEQRRDMAMTPSRTSCSISPSKYCMPSRAPSRIASSSVLPSPSPRSMYSRVRMVDFNSSSTASRPPLFFGTRRCEMK